MSGYFCTSSRLIIATSRAVVWWLSSSVSPQQSVKCEMCIRDSHKGKVCQSRNQCQTAAAAAKYCCDLRNHAGCQSLLDVYKIQNQRRLTKVFPNLRDFLQHIVVLVACVLLFQLAYHVGKHTARNLIHQCLDVYAKNLGICLLYTSQRINAGFQLNECAEISHSCNLTGYNIADCVLGCCIFPRAVSYTHLFRSAQDDTVYDNQRNINPQRIIQGRNKALQQKLHHRNQRRSDDDERRNSHLIGNNLAQCGNDQIAQCKDCLLYTSRCV